MGVIHKKGCPQDNVGADHSHDMDNDPLLSKHGPNPWFLPKASCSIPTKSETIADHGKEEEVRISFPPLDRQHGRSEKDDGIGPHIAGSPPMMTTGAFGRTECHDASDSRHESRKGMHDERKEEGEGKTIGHASRLLCLTPFRCSHLLLHRSVPASEEEGK